MKKNRRFLKALLIYCLVLALVLGGVLFTLSRFLVAYEASRPDNTAEDFVSSHDRSFWTGGLQELVDRGFSEFTLAGSDISDFGIDSSAEIRWRSGSGDENSREYEVRLGSKTICILTLVPHESVGFGMHSWTVSGWEFTMPGGSDITVSVPAGCTAEINGVEVAASYISRSEAMALPLDHAFDIPPQADIYEIKGMLGPAEIKAYTPEGVELAAENPGGGQVYFFPEAVHGFDFCALSDSRVYINGEEIGSEFSEALDLGLDTGDAIVRYSCEGLYTSPEIRVEHGGEKVDATVLPFGNCYIPGAGEEISGDLAEFIEGFIHAYVDFSSNKDRAADANFYALAQYLKADSELYRLTLATIDNIVWASSSNIRFNGMDYGDLIPLGDGRCICSIFYDVSYTLGTSELHIQNGNTILIEEEGSGYAVSAMSAALDS